MRTPILFPKSHKPTPGAVLVAYSLDIEGPSCFNATSHPTDKTTMDMRYVFIVIITALLAGCGCGKCNVEEKKCEVDRCATMCLERPGTPGDEATVKLAEAAVSISQSLHDLAAVEEASTPGYYNYKMLPHVTPHNMPGTVSVDWSGPIEPLLRRLASLSGYHLNVMGRRPAIPVIITLYTRERSIAYVMRDVAFQALHKAKVLVYPATHTIELLYMRP